MPRDWTGSVFTTPAGTFAAKWQQYETKRWRVTKGFATRSEAADFLAKRRADFRAKRAGVFDAFAEHRVRPLPEHVEDFRAHILGNRRRRVGARSQKHANQTRQRLLDAFAAMRAGFLSDLVPSKAERFLAHLLDVDGRTIKTRNDYCAALKQFSRWLEADQRIERDTLRTLRLIDNVGGGKRKQTLTWEQVRQLAAAAIQRALQVSPPGHRDARVELGRRRALAIVLMFLTGLRNNEAACLRWDWIDLEARLVTLPHTVTKSGRLETVPVHDGLAALLERERRRRGVLAGQPVAGGDLVVGEFVNGEPKLPRHVNDRLREDADWVRLPAVDAAGRVLSIYSMRSSFATALDAHGVPPSVVSQLMRHRPGGVTEAHYVQRANALLLAAINSIPAEAAHVTGLWDEGPDSLPTTMRGDTPPSAPESKTDAI